MVKPRKKEKKGEIEVRISPDADQRTRKVVGNVMTLLEGPVFAKLVRETVEDFCLDAKLIYDLETDEFYETEDHLKLVALRVIEGRN
ncbi:MAG: hypothetical protein ACMUIE_02285 [Thermoplasmatota archaeon]